MAKISDRVRILEGRHGFSVGDEGVIRRIEDWGERGNDTSPEEQYLDGRYVVFFVTVANFEQALTHNEFEVIE